MAPSGVILLRSRSLSCCWIFKEVVSGSPRNLTFSGNTFGLPRHSTLKRLLSSVFLRLLNGRLWRELSRLYLFPFPP